MDFNEPIQVIERGSILKNEYYCSITELLDMYQDYDSELKSIMRTYMMTPEEHDGKYYIPIRVPGATRGHIEVKPNGDFWEVVTIRLYESSAIIGVSNIGCYKPDVEKVLDSFNGKHINFTGFKPKEVHKWPR